MIISKAIEANNNLTYSYFNRAVCKQVLRTIYQQA